MRVNVDDVAADGLGGDQRQRQVLMFGVQREVLLVDGALVYRVRARVVYHFAANG